MLLFMISRIKHRHAIDNDSFRYSVFFLFGSSKIGKCYIHSGDVVKVHEVFYIGEE